MGLLVLTIEAVPAASANKPKDAASSSSGGLNSGSIPRPGRLGDKVREPEKPPSVVVGNIIEALNNLTEQKTRETAKISRDDVRAAVRSELPAWATPTPVPDKPAPRAPVSLSPAPAAPPARGERRALPRQPPKRSQRWRRLLRRTGGSRRREFP